MSIFIGGLGFGGVLEAMRHRHSDDRLEDGRDRVDWVSTTLANLERSLSLTEAQKERLKPEIEATAREIDLIREGALLKFEISLLKLHRSIAPDLDPNQLDELKRSEQSLEDRIRRRSETLLRNEEEPGPPPTP